MKNATLPNTKWSVSAKSIVVALTAMLSLTGCPSKKNDSGVAVPPYNTPYTGSYGYNNAYCYPNPYSSPAGCYNQSGYGNMFVSGLGRINSPSSLEAEVAVSFLASQSFNTVGAYGGNVTIQGTMNVYSSSAICPIPPGQYQLYGNGTMNSLSFTGSIATTSGARQVVIKFTNSFLTPGPVTSSVGPQFAYSVQNDIEVGVQGYYGLVSCGPYVMY